MSEITSESQLHNPPRQIGVPNIPIPQTNLGFLEHTGIPFEPIENITDVPPSYDWMATQWKYHDQFQVSAVGDKSAPGSILYQTKVIQNSRPNEGQQVPNWFNVPFGYSVWWTGAVSYRFTIVKPPRVTGKILVRFAQDAFGHDQNDPVEIQKGIDRDVLHRSILKEWDLSQSNQFEFDLTGSLPIRARPTKLPYLKAPGGSEGDKPDKEVSYGNAPNYTPWIETEMGRIVLTMAQYLVPGSIFPDTYTVLVEKSFKNIQFYTPTDASSQYRLIIANNDLQK